MWCYRFLIREDGLFNSICITPVLDITGAEPFWLVGLDTKISFSSNGITAFFWTLSWLSFDTQLSFAIELMSSILIQCYLQWILKVMPYKVANSSWFSLCKTLLHFESMFLTSAYHLDTSLFERCLSVLFECRAHRECFRLLSCDWGYSDTVFWSGLYLAFLCIGWCTFVATAANIWCHGFLGGSLHLLIRIWMITIYFAESGLLFSRYDALVCPCCSCSLLMVP